MSNFKQRWNDFVYSKYFVPVLCLLTLVIFSTLLVLACEYIFGI